MSRQQSYDALVNVAGHKLITTFDRYVNDRTLLNFECKQCSKQYETTAFNYFKGDVFCKHHKASDSNSMVEQFEKIHGQYYDYSFVDMNEHLTRVNVGCPKHGLFALEINDHLAGKGCPSCLVENINVSDPLTDFINQAHHKHGFRYIYDSVTKEGLAGQLEIACPKHGHFSSTADAHVAGQGCPICAQNYGMISNIGLKLTQHELAYTTEKHFDGCVSDGGRALRFDIYVPQLHLCIEVDGPHHFEPTKYTTETTTQQAKFYFDIQTRNDHLKSKYCADNNIELIRVAYNDTNYMFSILHYIQNLPNRRYIYTWSDFETDIPRIVSYIKTFGYSKFAVYGIARGGLPFSVHVSNHFEDMCQHGIITFQRYDGNDKIATIDIAHEDPSVPIFVIDDLISSGITIDKVVNKLHEQYGNEVKVHPIVIFGAHNTKNIFFIRHHPQQWIVFPYEI